MCVSVCACMCVWTDRGMSMNIVDLFSFTYEHSLAVCKVEVFRVIVSFVLENSHLL